LTRLLVLLDVDGTLFLTHDPLAGEAMHETLEERFELRLRQDAPERVDHDGQTALRIARLVLAEAGVEAGRIDASLPGWCPRFAERYLELLATADTGGWRAAPGARETLERLEHSGHLLALLTGNPEPMARARMERLGLASFFAGGQGAFGCESESRAELIDHARARAGDWPADATVEIGDTARDEASARAAGIRSILVGRSGLASAAGRLLGPSA
jgi:phosphoglycolate phosphatase-like HAD superfamily hydrolase